MSVSRNKADETESNLGIAAPDVSSMMETLDTLAVWLKEAGLTDCAIAQWKFNGLARMCPQLTDIIEEAKRLLGATQPLEEIGLTVTEVANRLTEELARKIKPQEVNQALVELGFQVRPDNGKRIWQLTEAGTEYGQSLLATSKTNEWSGPQVTWRVSIFPLLVDYFEAIERETATIEVDEPNQTDLMQLVAEATPRTWSLSDRLKILKKKVTASQRLHIEMEAAQAYKERHGKPPDKEQFRGKYYDSFPDEDADLWDLVIERVLKRYAKNS